MISPGGTGYVYAINSTDYLQLYVQTAPGVGTTSSFTRKLWIALSGTDNDTYPAANELVNSGCQMSWNYFADISTPPAGISITQSASLTDMTDAANEPTCYFNHLYGA